MNWRPSRRGPLIGAGVAAVAAAAAAAVILVSSPSGEDGDPARTSRAGATASTDAAASTGSPAAGAEGEPSPARHEPAAQRRPGHRRRLRHLTVSVSGDLLMHEPLLATARADAHGKGYDFTPFFDRIRRYVRGADIALCHVETPMGPPPYTGYPIFNTPAGLAASIAKSGWDGCDSASNHSLDQGSAGVAATGKALDHAKVAHTGSFPSKAASRRPTIIRHGGFKLGLVAYTDSTNGEPPPHPWSVNSYDPTETKAAARRILADARKARRAGADAVLVNLHWGDENSGSPNDSQRRLAKRLAGAKPISAIVGQGPHVVQPIERIHGTYVVFSEGNLVSNQAASTGLPTETEDGLVALLRFRLRGKHARVAGVRYAPTFVRLGDYAVLPARPGSDRKQARALRDSYRRTRAAVGHEPGVKPSFGPRR